MRVVISARHFENGEVYEWLLPESLFDLFCCERKKSEFWSDDLLALVENQGSVSVVQVVDYTLVAKAQVLNLEHPFKKVVYLWRGLARNFIVGFEEQILENDEDIENEED